MLKLFFFESILPVAKLIGDIIGDPLVNIIKLYRIVYLFREFVLMLADIFIILLFNVDLALYGCLGCLKRRNVRQGP